jgi:hypothetical protein
METSNRFRGIDSARLGRFTNTGSDLERTNAKMLLLANWKKLSFAYQAKTLFYGKVRQLHTLFVHIIGPKQKISKKILTIYPT